MKRRILPAIATAALLALPVVAAAHPEHAMHAHHRDDHRGYGMGGYGMMSPGMGGYGMMGSGMGGYGMIGWIDDLPEAKQKQLDALHLSMMSAMRAKHRDMREAREAMHEAMHRYPVDQAAAQQALDRMTQIHKEMLAFRLGMMQQMQEIIGKEHWEDMQERFDEVHDHMRGWGRGAMHR